MDTIPIELEALERVFRDPSAEPIKVSYGLLRSVTHNFSSEIGRGGFGVVFLGCLGNEKIAVKKLSNVQGFSYKQFLDEIRCLTRAKHKNIVRFLGYCSDTQSELAKYEGEYVVAEVQEKLLCFEYVPNGNIQRYLEEISSGDDWHIRYKMISGICQGLRYLHKQRIGHFDLKPENVMLDSHMEPKIADFGSSRFLNVGKTVIFTTNISGTRGYIAPETMTRGELSFMSDIYALGIIVIKLLTGPANIDFDHWHESLVGDFPQMKSCIDIARACVEIEKSKRPTIGKIIDILNDIGNTESSTNQRYIAKPSKELVITVNSLQEWGKQIDPLVVVHFCAGWCRASRMISPVLADLAKKFRNVVFLKVDVDIDEMMTLAEKFSVEGVPTFLFMRGGYVKDRVLGADKGGLEEVLEEQG